MEMQVPAQMEAPGMQEVDLGEAQTPSRAAFLMASTASFHPPEWACEPIEANSEARFDVYRDSRHCATYMIATQSVNMFGRDQDCCDHVLGNPTISRKHAAVIHDSEGGVHMVDLMSRHGTFIGKTKLPPHDPVLLHDGDIIRFGQSARVYILRGVSSKHKSAAVKKTWGRLKFGGGRKKGTSSSSAAAKRAKNKKYSTATLKLINDLCYHNLTNEKMDTFLQTAREMDEDARRELADLLVEKIYAKFEFYAAFVHRNAYVMTVALLKRNLLIEELEANLSTITQLSQSRHDSIYRANARKILQLMAAVRLDPNNVQSPLNALAGASDGQVCPPTTSHQAQHQRVMLAEDDEDGEQQRRSRQNSIGESTQNGDEDASSQHSGYQPPPTGWPATNGYAHNAMYRPPQEHALSPPQSASSNGEYRPPMPHQPASGGQPSAFGFLSTAPTISSVGREDGEDEDDDEDAGRPSGMTSFAFLHNDAAPVSVGPSLPRVQAEDFLKDVSSISIDETAFESLWESTNDADEWNVELVDALELSEVVSALQQARLLLVSSDKVGGTQRLRMIAEQQQEATMFLVELELMPGQSACAVTFKWVVNSLLYDNAHELFIELVKFVLHPFCDSDADTERALEGDNEAAAAASRRPTAAGNYHEPEKSTSETTQSTREAADDQDDDDADEWDVLPVVDYLTERAAIEPARFEQLWVSATTIGTLSCGLPDAVPEKDAVIALFQRNRLSCLASGQVDTLIKFYFYGEMLELQTLLCAELVLDTDAASVSGTIKRFAFQPRSEDETEQIDSSFVDYVEKLVQAL